jgi:adenylosuccinate synthase
MLTESVISVIGNGVVIDPVALMDEIAMLEDHGIKVKGRLYISHKAHLIMPYHKVLDQVREAQQKAIGTTGRGIGPAYNDKARRNGIRIVDLLDRKTLEEKIRENVKEKNEILNKIYGYEQFNVEDIISRYLEFDKLIDPYIKDTTEYLNTAIADGKRIIAEGAQGALLDLDHGTYPYVTSSNPTSGGACTGLGIPPTSIDKVMGVVKAYTTRVGNGPFPTELLDETGDLLRTTGAEFGATTGRPRRCGWLDLVALKYSVMINGISEIALTKLDVLDAFKDIYLCEGYEVDSKLLKHFPNDVRTLNAVKPVLRKVAGWQKPLSGTKSIEALPIETQDYLKEIEKYTGARIKMVSLSPEREDTIIVD